MFLELTYSKLNNARWISHRDMIQYFSRLFRRAELSIEYTQGFSPHPIIVFSLAHSVGIEGEHELLIVKIPEDTVNISAICSSLQRKSVPDVPIHNVSLCDSKKRFFAGISRIRYIFQCEPHCIDENKFSTIAKMREVTIEKGKKKTLVNIADEITASYVENSDYIIECRYCQNGAVTDKNIRSMFSNLFDFDADHLFCKRKLIKKDCGTGA